MSPHTKSPVPPTRVARKPAALGGSATRAGAWSARSWVTSSASCSLSAATTASTAPPGSMICAWSHTTHRRPMYSTRASAALRRASGDRPASSLLGVVMGGLLVLDEGEAVAECLGQSGYVGDLRFGPADLPIRDRPVRHVDLRGEGAL